MWEGNEHLEKENMTVPGSCCKDIQEQLSCQKDPENEAFEDVSRKKKAFFSKLFIDSCLYYCLLNLRYSSDYFS